MRITTKYLLIILMATIFGSMSLSAMAGGYGECEHPRFLEHGCGYGSDGKDGKDGLDGQDGRPGADGADGADGLAGADGADGADGRDGVDGIDGRDGVDGRDGDVPTEWYNTTQTNYDEMISMYDDQRDAMAAATAVQIHLPQEKSFRMTLGTARVNGRQGLGVGFAMKADDQVAFTVGVGQSDSETVVTAAASFEF